MKRTLIYFYLSSTISVVELEGLVASMESLVTEALVALEAKGMFGMFYWIPILENLKFLQRDRTEKHSDSVSAHARPGGANGRNGPPGNRAATFLTGGKW